MCLFRPEHFSRQSLSRLIWPQCFVFALVYAGILNAREFEGSRENSILLNGPWEFVAGDGTEGAETAAGQRNIEWRQVNLPGPFMSWSKEAASKTKFVWARRSFNLTPTQADKL